ADISGLVAGEGAKYSDRYVESLAGKISDAIYFAGGAEKVLFGSDYPIETFSAGFKLMRKLQIDEGDQRRIYRDNALKVFFSDA
ncbi:MAG: amidohydrolase, partial [Thaumarchaeota archaeon]|nr:amidohydrolase [Nitrososphaerota archaeon]